MGLVSLGMGYWTWRAGWDNWQTMLFTTLTLSQMGHALAVRSRESLFKVGLLSNKALLGAVLLTFVLQMAVVYVPFLQNLFKTGCPVTGRTAAQPGPQHGGVLGLSNWKSGLCGGERALMTSENLWSWAFWPSPWSCSSAKSCGSTWWP